MAMEQLISNIDDKSDLIEFMEKADVEAFNKQKSAYEVTRAFLKRLDREVALSFLATNARLRGELGIFYEQLVEEL